MYFTRRMILAALLICGGLWTFKALAQPPEKAETTAVEAPVKATDTPAKSEEKPVEGSTPTSTEAAPAAPMKPADQLESEQAVAIDTIWVLLAGCLVMWMQAGFALVETGLTRAKNAVNICMKNLLDFCFGAVAYWAIGFSIMFGFGGEKNDYWGGTSAMFLKETPLEIEQADKTMKKTTNLDSLSWATVPLEAKFFFQLMFAATTATIVSGAMAERTKFTSYMIYSFVVSLVIYPISGHWIWGGGWLASMGFWDFAGSTVVHSLGGWLSLIGAFIIGPRIGKYGPDGKPRAIPGHNLVLLTLGLFILWLGWFGFNPGSTMAMNPTHTATPYIDAARIAIVTNMSGAVGTVAALFTARLLFGKWEATMAINGGLAGLVAITAPCMWISMEHAFLVGLIAGVLVVFSVLFFDRIKIDDPVGAISVHGVCGAFGTLCVGLFSTGNGNASPKPGLFSGLEGASAEQLIIQAKGVLAVFVWGIVTGAILFTVLKFTVGLRVTAKEEEEGLDFGEHGNEAYHGFAFTSES